MAIFSAFFLWSPLGNYEKKSCLDKLNFLRGFTKSKKKHMLIISVVYLIGNPEICQGPPSCGQDDQTLLIIQQFHRWVFVIHD